MTGPDRIWVTAYYSQNRSEHVREWSERGYDDLQAYEYIRADLVQSLIKAAQDLDRQFCDDDLGPSALAMGKLREAYMRLK